MHPSFRHVFGGEEITPEPPAVILHFGAHSSSFQVSGQFQPSKNILPNLYGKWMAMIIVIGRDFLILYGPVPLNEQFYKWGKRRSKCFLGHTLYLLPLEKWTGINLHSFLFRTSSFWKRILVIFRTRDGLEIVQCLTQIYLDSDMRHAIFSIMTVTHVYM